MPKVTIDNSRGLVQEGGSGLVVKSSATFNNLVLTAESVTAAGAASVTVPVTLTTSDGDTMAVTLADGSTEGQMKYFVELHATNATSITPASTCGGWSVATLTNAGENVTMVWTASGWALIGRSGGATQSSATAVAGQPIIG